MAVAAGCATSIVDQPAEFKGNPSIVAIYAVDTAIPVTQLVFQYQSPTPPSAPAPMPDVLVYSAKEPDKASPFPSSYGAIRVEFDQPLTAASVATNNDITSLAQPDMPLASFCSPLSSPTIKLLEGAAPGGRALVNSVCYDPTSALGQNPHITLFIGSQTAFNAAANPFVCSPYPGATAGAPPALLGDDPGAQGVLGNVFVPADFNTADLTTGNGCSKATSLADLPSRSCGANALIPGGTYTLKLDEANIKGSSGNSLKAPTSAGWTAGALTLKIADFDLMAVGTQDPNTGFFQFLDKPYRGFLKDLDAVGEAGFLLPPTDQPLILYFTRPMNLSLDGDVGLSFPVTAASKPGVTCGSGAPQPACPKAVSVFRADGTTPFDSFVWNDIAVGGFTGDPRIIYVAPGGALPGVSAANNRFTAGRWEPGQSYKVVLNGTAACDAIDTQSTGNCVVVGTPQTTNVGKTYTVRTDTTLTPAHTGDGGEVVITDAYPVPAAATPLYDVGFRSNFFRALIQFSVPVDPATVNTTTVKITKADGTALPGVVSLFGAPTPTGGTPDPANAQGLGLTTNNQVVLWSSRDPADLPGAKPNLPGHRLPPATQLTLTVNGVKADKTLPAPLGGVAFPAFSNTFTTANFRTSQLTRTCTNFPGNPECTNQGLGAGAIQLSIDRATNQPIDTLTTPGRTLALWFDRPTDDVSPKAPGNITVEEVGGIKLAASQLAITNLPAKTSSRNQRPANTDYQIRVIDTQYRLKCSQQYRVTASTNIKDDETPPVSLKAEGCTTGDCSDSRSFTTAAFSPQSFDRQNNRIDVATTDKKTVGTTTLTCSSKRPCLSITFNGPLQAASVNPNFASTIKVFPQDAQGNNLTPVGVTCAPLPDNAQTTIVCQPSADLALNTPHLASAVFQQDPANNIDTRAVIADTAFGQPTDNSRATGSCLFKGSITRTFSTPCL